MEGSGTPATCTVGPPAKNTAGAVAEASGETVGTALTAAKFRPVVTAAGPALGVTFRWAVAGRSSASGTKGLLVGLSADYLRYVLNRITLPGSIYLGVIAVLPNVFLQMGNSGGVQNLPFGGTAVLIMIGVGLDTVKQIESQLMQRNYEGFLK